MLLPYLDLEKVDICVASANIRDIFMSNNFTVWYIECVVIFTKLLFHIKAATS